MDQPLKIYIPVGPTVEIELTCVARVSNGIDTDPAVILREPTVKEMFALVDQTGRPRFLEHVSLSPTLDY